MSASLPAIYLASASPRRAELLAHPALGAGLVVLTVALTIQIRSAARGRWPRRSTTIPRSYRSSSTSRSGISCPSPSWRSGADLSAPGM